LKCPLLQGGHLIAGNEHWDRWKLNKLAIRYYRDWWMHIIIINDWRTQGCG